MHLIDITREACEGKLLNLMLLCFSYDLVLYLEMSHVCLEHNGDVFDLNALK